jgi:O-antigen/teichoic acid export membrane protein
MITIRNFRLETKYKFKRELGLTKEILSFSGWNLFGQIAVLSSNQGVTILYNLFLGITVNAALAIGQQVRGLVGTLANNLQVAFNPQIVQSYACGDVEHHNVLVLNASRYSLYLISIIAIPFLLCSDTILQLWLGKNLPTYASYFAKAMIWVTILDCISGPFWMSAHAKGNIKQYQLVVSAIFLLNLPLTYGLYQFSHSVYVSFFATIGVVGGALIYRMNYFFKGNHLSKKCNIFTLKILAMCFVF